MLRLRPMHRSPSPQKLQKPFYQQLVFLWVGIGLIVVLIGGMSLKLLKDMETEGQ